VSPDDSLYPEIASVDEIFNGGGIYDYYFAIVWEESMQPGKIVWYADGTTTIGAGPPTVLTPGSLGQINPIHAAGDSYDPDIAATQDYQNPETYYFHIDYVRRMFGGGMAYHIDTCYSVGASPTPGFNSFIPTASARGPINIVLDRPTIASKLISIAPAVFETWMCWEENIFPAANRDIWYRMGQCIGGPFGYMVPAALVPYIQPPLSAEYNPELWNRNDAARMFPQMTHLVFDMPLAGGPIPEIEYIDP